MCTILILRHVHPEFPLVLASNRDEFYGRPARSPEVLLERPRAVGGRDVARGGTWMGVTQSGFFVGITNQRTATPTEAAPRSRGEIVLSALEAGDCDGVERYLDALNPTLFNPFNLLYGDAARLRVAYARPGLRRVEREDVPEGIHVLPNDTLDSPSLPKVARARALALPLAQAPWPSLKSGLESLLADAELPPWELVPKPPAGSSLTPEILRQLQALCIHTSAYGTRSSAIVALAHGRVVHYLAMQGPPCQSRFEDVTPLLSADAR